MAVRGVLLKRAHTPQRTCAGCRAIAPKATLVRVVLAGDHLVVGAGPGRGAYLHPRAECVEAAARGGLSRSLRRGVPAQEVRRIAAGLSLLGDNPSATAASLGCAGLDHAEAVETAPRAKKDDRREDARL